VQTVSSCVKVLGLGWGLHMTAFDRTTIVDTSLTRQRNLDVMKHRAPGGLIPHLLGVHLSVVCTYCRSLNRIKCVYYLEQSRVEIVLRCERRDRQQTRAADEQ
jgi:hypothetical protein